MKRWIIRSFFIALLLLFVGGWVVSYQYNWGFGHEGPNSWFAGVYFGKLSLAWSHYRITWSHQQTDFIARQDKWFVGGRPLTASDSEVVDYINSHSILGFAISRRDNGLLADIPFWFPTII